MPLFNQPQLLQTAEAHISTDVTNAVAGFQTLLTMSITTGANALIISAAGSISCTLAANAMAVRVTVDGASQGGCQIKCVSNNIGQSFNLRVKTAVLTAGAHTILLQWQTAGGTQQCRFVTNPDAESASLVVEEVTV
jgi:hypothetical protein